MANESARLPVVLKTYKLFIGGKFPRTESGRYLVARDRKDQHVANYCHASKKDLRDAVRAARKAQSGWASSSAYLKGQILYRMAEMMEARADALAGELRDAGLTAPNARKEVDASIDRLIYYAGWSDKYSSVFGSVNPVASPHWNVTSLEATGVVVVIGPDEPGLLGLVTLVSAAMVSGNAVVGLASEVHPLPAMTFAEVAATSDVPGGVINLLTGKRAELAPIMASHMDVNAIVDASCDEEIRNVVAEGAAANVKRISQWGLKRNDWFSDEAENPYRIPGHH